MTDIIMLTVGISVILAIGASSFADTHSLLRTITSGLIASAVVVPTGLMLRNDMARVHQASESSEIDGRSYAMISERKGRNCVADAMIDKAMQDGRISTSEYRSIGKILERDMTDESKNKLRATYGNSECGVVPAK